MQSWASPCTWMVHCVHLHAGGSSRLHSVRTILTVRCAMCAAIDLSPQPTPGDLVLRWALRSLKSLYYKYWLHNVYTVSLVATFLHGGRLVYIVRATCQRAGHLDRFACLASSQERFQWPPKHSSLAAILCSRCLYIRRVSILKNP